MLTNIKWIEGKLKKKNIWKNNLFSIIFTANINKFIPGQFGKIKINYNNKNIIRAYSYINYNNNLEFYIRRIKNGIVSNYLYNLNINDTILISKKSYGNFIIKNIKCNTLWMIAMGTGISPYISILSSKKRFKYIKKIVLIYLIKYEYDFNYKKIIYKIKNNIKNNLFIIEIINKNINDNYFNGKLIELINNKSIEKKINIYIDIVNDYFMICGISKLVDETKKFLINNKQINENRIIFEKF